MKYVDTGSRIMRTRDYLRELKQAGDWERYDAIKRRYQDWKLREGVTWN